MLGWKNLVVIVGPFFKKFFFGLFFFVWSKLLKEFFLFQWSSLMIPSFIVFFLKFGQNSGLDELFFRGRVGGQKNNKNNNWCREIGGKRSFKSFCIMLTKTQISSFVFLMFQRQHYEVFGDLYTRGSLWWSWASLIRKFCLVLCVLC